MKPRLGKPIRIIALSLASSQLVHADSATWNGTSDGTWANVSNWSSNPNPVPGTGNTATFNNAGGLVDVIDLGAGVTISSIIFDTVDVAAYTLGSGGIGTQSLTLEDGGSINLNNGVNANHTFNSNIVLGGDGSAQNYTFSNSDLSTDPELETISLVFAGTISGGSGGVAGPKVLTIDSSSKQESAVSIRGAISDGGAESLAIVKTGSGSSAFSGAVHTFTGGVSVQAGTFLLSGGTLLPPASVVSLGSSGNTGDAVTLGVVNAATNPTAGLEVVDQVLGAPTTRVLSAPYPTSGQWSGPIMMNDGLTVSAANLAFTLQTGATVNLNSNTLTLANSSATSGANVVAKGKISGAGNVVINNTSTGSPNVGLVILEGTAHDYTGSTTISAGILQLGNNGTVGSLSATSSITNDGILAFRRTNAVTQGTDFAGAITGSGAIQVTGTNNVTFNLANIYSGTTSIGKGGILTVATGGSIAPVTGAALNVGFNAPVHGTGAGTFQYDSAATSRFGAIIVGNGTSNGGTLNQTNGIIYASSLTLSNTFSAGNGNVTIGNDTGNSATMNLTGNTTVSAASSAALSTLTVKSTSSLAIGGNLLFCTSTTRSANGTLTQTGGTVSAASLNLSGNISDTSARTHTSVYNLDGGTFTTGPITAGAIIGSPTTGAHAISATFNFNGGTLKPAGNSAVFWNANSVVTANVKNGGAKIDTAGFNITVTQPLLKFAGSTTDSLTKNGLGTLTLAGINTYSGDTTVIAGTLSLGQVNTSNELSAVSIASSAFLNLGFGGIDTVDKLFINGIQQPAGDYTSAHASGRFTGGGTLRVSTGPAAGGFASWIDDFGLAVADQDPTDDPDNDGMDNLLEFALNGNPSVSDPSIMPDLVVTLTAFEFTYQRRDDSVAPETTQTFQWGTTLATRPGSAVIPAISGPVGAATVTVSQGVPDNAVTDTVKVSIPKTAAGGAGKLFGRLQVVKP